MATSGQERQSQSVLVILLVVIGLIPTQSFALFGVLYWSLYGHFLSAHFVPQVTQFAHDAGGLLAVEFQHMV